MEENNGGSEENQPVKLIEFLENSKGTTIQLRHDTIDSLCRKIGDRPIAIYDVCGPSRLGKSFFLGYVIRRLEALEAGEQDDWMGWSEPRKPLKGFKFRNGNKPETQGIWIWSRPFIIKAAGNKEVAVLLVDTQGTNDEFTTSKDMAAIVGLSLLMSSVMVFNHFTNLQEDILSALNTYIQYGTLALEQDDYSGYPFQKLSFLIRDWNNPEEFKYGAKGGEQFLNRKLQVKPSQPPEAKHVRQTIRSCFQEVGCFLMPSIGEEAKSLKFQGSISELAPIFAEKLEECIDELISPDNILIKKLLDSPVTASELKSLLETYIKIFNSDEVPSAESMWQATSRMANGNVLEKSLKKYNTFMEGLIDKSPYLSEESLKQNHSEGKAEAVNLFTTAKKIGSPEVIKEFQDKLVTNIELTFAEIKKENERKREKFIQEASLQASEQFKVKLSNEFPLESGNGDPDFHDEGKISEVATQIMSSLLEDFREKLKNEPGDKLVGHIATVEKSFQDILSSYLNTNKVNMANAEKQTASIVEELAISHLSRLRKFMDDNKEEDDEAELRAAHDGMRSTTLQEFRQRQKSGGSQFNLEYEVKLENKMEENFNLLKGDHMRYIQDVKAKGRESVEICITKYKQLFNEAIDQVDSYEELVNIHKTAKATVIGQLLEGNPKANEKFRMELLEKVEESFADGKKLFESIQAGKSALAQAEQHSKAAVQALADAEAAKKAAEEAEARRLAAAEAAKAKAAEMQEKIDEANRRAAAASIGRGQGGRPPRPDWVAPVCQMFGAIAGAFLSGRGRR